MIKYLTFQFKTAFEDFKRNKTRTFLASLGIMIGVLSVVMLIALGLGLKNYIQGQFENLGTNMIMILPGGGFTSGGFGKGLVGGVEFDERDVSNLERSSMFEYVIPIFMKSGIIETETEKQAGSIMGTNSDLFEAMNIEPLYGEVLTKADTQKKTKEVVIGFTLAEKLFKDPANALGKSIRFNNQRFIIKGVAKKKGDSDTDSAVFMAYKTTFGSLNPKKTFWAIYLGVENEKDVTSAKDKAKEILLKRYKEDDFSVTEQSELLGMINQIFGMINAVLVAIGSISLVVGGIGIMNIMYANVTERTKEIGIMRAIGATKKDILVQFVAESILLSLFGGVLGLLTSTLIVLIVHPFFPIALNGLAVLAAIGISTLIGIFFGVFPARRASNLTPIEAIRYE